MSYQMAKAKQNIMKVPLGAMKKIADVLDRNDRLNDLECIAHVEHDGNVTEIDISHLINETKPVLRISQVTSKYGYQQVYIRFRIDYSPFGFGDHAIVDVYRKLPSTNLIDETTQAAYEQLIEQLENIVQQREIENK